MAENCLKILEVGKMSEKLFLEEVQKCQKMYQESLKIKKKIGYKNFSKFSSENIYLTFLYFTNCLTF